MLTTKLRALCSVGFLLFAIGLNAQVPNRFERKPVKSQAQDSSKVPEEKPFSNEEPKVTQATKKTPFYKKLRYGGTGSLQFGNITSVMLNPRVAYPVDDRLLVGLGITYLYVSDGRFEPKLEQSIYGFSPFVNYKVYGPLALAAEYELLRAQVVDGFRGLNPVFNEEWVSALYLGGAYLPDGPFYFSILFNVLYDPLRSVYANPVIRVGVLF